MRRFLRRLPDGAGDKALFPNNVPGLFLWLDATTNLGAPNSQIADWTDRSGNNRDAFQTLVPNRPFVTDGSAGAPHAPNGKHGVSFNFTIPSWMGGTLPAGPAGIGTTTGQTYYLWTWQVNFSKPAQVVWQDQFGASPQLLFADGADNVGWRDNLATHAIAPKTAGFQSMVWEFAPPDDGTGVCTMYRNGASIGSANWKFQFPTTDSYFLGVNQVANAGFAGMMYEFLAYTGAHTAQIRNLLLAYGSRKWSIP